MGEEDLLAREELRDMIRDEEKDTGVDACQCSVRSLRLFFIPSGRC